MSIRVVLFLRLVMAPCGLSAAPAPPDPKVPAPLAKKRLDAARKTFEGYLRMFRNKGSPDPEKLYVWSRRLMEAEQALGDDKSTARAAVQAHLDRMKELERICADFARAQQGLQVDAEAARYYRIEAEIWLSQTKGK